MVQEMGRVNQQHNASDGTNLYNICFNVNTFLSLWLHIQSESNFSVQNCQRHDLFQILSMLFLPQGCYHDVIEQYFEHPATYNKEPSCSNNCSCCDGSFKSFCGTISKHQLISILTCRIFDKGSIAATSLVGMISSPSNKRVKQAIRRDSSRNISPGQVHALILMLIASNIISLNAPPLLAVGNFVPLNTVQFSLTKQFALPNDDFETFALYIDSNWERIPFAP